MKLKITPPQQFYLKLLNENPDFRIEKINGYIYMSDGIYELFRIPKKAYDNMKTLKLI